MRDVFVLGRPGCIIINLLGTAPSDFSILLSSRNTSQSPKLETPESSLTSPFPSRAVTASFKSESTLWNESPFGPRFCYLRLGLLWKFSERECVSVWLCPTFNSLHISTSNNFPKIFFGSTGFRYLFFDFQALHQQHSFSLILFLFCSRKPVLKEQGPILCCFPPQGGCSRLLWVFRTYAHM